MSKKQIVCLINSLEGGGAERFVVTLLNTLVDSCECYLILLEYKITYEIDDRVKIITLGSNLQNQSGFTKLISLPKLAYKLSKIMKENNFTQLISFLYRSNYINILAKIFSKHRSIISERIAPSSMYSDNSLNSKVSKFLIKNLYNRADLILPVSFAIQKDLENNFSINIEQKIIYNGYDIDHIDNKAKENIDIDIDKNNSIISVGSLNKRKNHELLIRALVALNTKIKLYILGVGEEYGNLKELVIDLNLENRVFFLGFDNNPYKYLSKCSIFVLVSNSEGFPNVLVEAMLCNCAVISTDCLSGPREILSDAKYGILIPTNDKNKLVEALNKLLDNKKQKYEYQKLARTRAEEFKISLVTNIYKEVLCVV